jgi:hypothetical protein
MNQATTTLTRTAGHIGNTSGPLRQNAKCRSPSHANYRHRAAPRSPRLALERYEARRSRAEERICVQSTDRLHALDAMRAYALLLGVVLHMP